MFYYLYRIGFFLANALPLRAAYRVAEAIGDICFSLSKKDRRAVVSNLSRVIGSHPGDPAVTRLARETFKNFAKYLVEFFRFGRMDDEWVRKNVVITGLQHLDEAIAKGKGTILLSAHIGNWELGGLVLARLRPPMAAVVLTHGDPRINNFFTNQRLIGSLKPIEFGMALRGCYRMLSGNGSLALLGDRDFSRAGVRVPFFGATAMMPKGPATLSRRLGSAIVPTFILRDGDGRFRVEMLSPIYPDANGTDQEGERRIMDTYLPLIESCVRKHPSQWYVFREIWSDESSDLRPDTII